MINFSIGTQIEKELEDFRNKKVRLASMKQEDSGVRYGKPKSEKGYYFNQADTLSLIDLYFNSKFESGFYDEQGKRKIFLNVGKFRSEVSAKQIDIDTKNFKFYPDDYADPWTAIFLDKDFREWAKDSELPELTNECVDNFPKYGTVVLKKVNKKIKWTPLQNLRNEQTAKSLQTASYVIEEHPDMQIYEIQEMAEWNSEGFELKLGETTNVYERYGRVPLKWLKEHDSSNRTVDKGDENKYVDAMVIAAKGNNNKTKEWNIFYAGEITERPYREVHWNKQHGRWLGLGVMEDLIENQQAKNIVVNLIRKGLQWQTKRAFQAVKVDDTSKNMARDVPDGAILEVGPQGELKEIPFYAKSNADFSSFLNEFEHNADQKAFTYEVATGEALPSGTPFRLGAILSSATNSFFNLKREKLGIFLKKVIMDFMVPQFLKDMGDEEKVISMFTGEPGFEVLKQAAMQMVRTEATRISLLSGQAVDTSSLESIVSPFMEAKTLFFPVSKDAYKNAKYKFDFTVVGEEIDIENKIETLKSLFTLLAQKGDSRAEEVLERLALLGGTTMSAFGPKPEMPQNPALNSTGGNTKLPVAQNNAAAPA